MLNSITPNMIPDSLRVAISPVVDSISRLPVAYGEIRKATLHIFTMPHIKIYDANHGVERISAIPFTPNRFLQAMRKAKPTALSTTLEEYGTFLQALPTFPAAQFHVQHLLQQCVMQCAAENPQISTQSKLEELTKSTAQCTTKEALLQEAVAWMNSLKSYITVQAHQEETDGIARAKDYLTQCYGNPELSLDVVAKQVFMSPAYFSRQFKRQCGMNFIDYLTNLRIAQAKAMLQNTDDYIYAVAERVGYPNVTYFSTIFKRLTGQTPQAYREGGEKSHESHVPS